MFSLPYFKSVMTTASKEDGVRYTSVRSRPDASGPALEAHCFPMGAVFRPSSGSLDEFLVSRYCLYSKTSRGVVTRTEIHHAPWTLEHAIVDLKMNTYARAAGFPMELDPQIIHFSKRIDVVAWLPENVTNGR